MKAKVFYKDDLGKNRTKTVEVEKNDVCEMVQEFIRVTKLPRWTYVSHVKCGRYDYQWKGDCHGAFWKEC